MAVRPMFGCHAIYVGERIYLMLRHKEDRATRADNGIWLVVADEAVAEIRKQFPALRPIEMFADFKKSTPTWYNLPEDHPDFESAALEFVAMVRRGDPRIGKVPQSARKKKAKLKKTTAKKAAAKNKQPRKAR